MPDMQLWTAESPIRGVHFNPKVMVHAAFIPTGMVTVLLGPLLPLLAARWSLSDAQAGYLISAQFMGSLVGTISSSLLLRRVGFRWSIAIGQALMAFGVSGLLSSIVAAATAAVFCYGIGIGLTIPCGNLVVAEGSAGRRSSTLNLLNFSWSAGAVSCPFILALAQHAHATQFFLRGVAGVLLVLTAILLTLPNEMPPPAHRRGSSKVAVPWSRYLQNSAAIMLGTLFFVYVGTENALGAWLASYAKRVSGSPPLGIWMTVSSYFYGALLVGRALAPATLRYLTDMRQACLGLVLSLASLGLLLVSRSVAGVAFCAFAAGLGLSTLYPITISFLSASFGREATNIGGAMFAFSTLGGASLPWLVGFASNEFGSLRAGLLVPLCGCLLMLAVFSWPRWRHQPE
jgi:FHS family glucose/mannose:H+ symporter-like MFS transporter